MNINQRKQILIISASLMIILLITASLSLKLPSNESTLLGYFIFTAVANYLICSTWLKPRPGGILNKIKTLAFYITVGAPLILTIKIIYLTIMTERDLSIEYSSMPWLMAIAVTVTALNLCLVTYFKRHEK